MNRGFLNPRSLVPGGKRISEAEKESGVESTAKQNDGIRGHHIPPLSLARGVTASALDVPTAVGVELE